MFDAAFFWLLTAVRCVPQAMPTFLPAGLPQGGKTVVARRTAGQFSTAPFSSRRQRPRAPQAAPCEPKAQDGVTEDMNIAEGV